jgi:hypothetical protein
MIVAAPCRTAWHGDARTYQVTYSWMGVATSSELLGVKEYHTSSFTSSFCFWFFYKCSNIQSLGNILGQSVLSLTVSCHNNRITSTRGA